MGSGVKVFLASTVGLFLHLRALFASIVRFIFINGRVLSGSIDE